MVAAAIGVIAAAAAVGAVGVAADAVETRREGAEGAKCPTAGPVLTLLLAEPFFAGLVTLLLAAAVDLAERTLPSVLTVGPLALRLDVVGRPVAPTFGPSVSWLDDGEPPVDGSACATAVPTAREAQKPTVTAPVPSKTETSRWGR